MISDPSMKVFGWLFQQIAANVNIWPLPYLSLADVGPLGMHPTRCVPIALPSSLTHGGRGGGGDAITLKKVLFGPNCLKPF